MSEDMFLSIAAHYLSDRRQSVRLVGKVNVSVDVVSWVPQGSVLGSLLFMLYTSELFHIIGNHMVGYANDTTIYAVFPRPLSRPQVVESLNQDLAAVHSWCLKWHIRLTPRKTKSMMVNSLRPMLPAMVISTFGGEELEVKCLVFLG